MGLANWPIGQGKRDKFKARNNDGFKEGEATLVTSSSHKGGVDEKEGHQVRETRAHNVGQTDKRVEEEEGGGEGTSRRAQTSCP